MARNQGGRPPMAEGKRSRKIDARFTEAEYRQVEEMEKALGLKKTELIRKRLLDNSSGLLINTRELLKKLDAVSLELARTGNNINQLAKYANRLNKHGVLSPQVSISLQSLLEQHHCQQLELQMLFRKMLRAMKH